MNVHLLENITKPIARILLDPENRLHEFATKNVERKSPEFSLSLLNEYISLATPQVGKDSLPINPRILKSLSDRTNGRAKYSGILREGVSFLRIFDEFGNDKDYTFRENRILTIVENKPATGETTLTKVEKDKENGRINSLRRTYKMGDSFIKQDELSFAHLKNGKEVFIWNSFLYSNPEGDFSQADPATFKTIILTQELMRGIGFTVDDLYLSRDEIIAKYNKSVSNTKVGYAPEDLADPKLALTYSSHI